MKIEKIFALCSVIDAAVGLAAYCIGKDYVIWLLFAILLTLWEIDSRIQEK